MKLRYFRAGAPILLAGANIEYFAPLMAWLGEQNKGQTCGWDG